MKEMKEPFEMCTFQPTNAYYQPGFAAKKAVVGKMNDEVVGYPIAEFLGLRPKMYSIEAMHTNPLDNREIR